MGPGLLLCQRVRVESSHRLRLFHLDSILHIVYRHIAYFLKERILFGQVVFEEAIQDQQQARYQLNKWPFTSTKLYLLKERLISPINTTVET
jgi:hypothetical protein